MAQIRANLSEFDVRAILNIALIDLVSFFNIGKQMDRVQVVSTVDLLLQEFYYLRPEDFKLCFNQAKKGQYGKVYDRLDGQIIFEWLNEYCIERAGYFETYRIKEKKEIESKPIDYHKVQLYHENNGKDYKDREKEKNADYNKWKAQYLLNKYKQNEANDNGKD